MTTANLLNVSPVKGAQVDVSKKLQEEAREVTEIFASMMNQTVDAVNQVAEDTSSEIGVSKADTTQAITHSYERYSYKENPIDTAKEQEVSVEELDAAEETLEHTEEEILNTLSEEYGVDEETLRKLLDDMGLSVLDLLEPKNLVNFIMTLTGIASGEELLLDESFLKVMETMDALSNNLMKELNVDKNGLQELISQMETISLDNGDASFQQELDTQLEQVSVEGSAPQLEQEEVIAQQTKQNPEEVTEDVRVQAEKQEEATGTKVSDAEVENATTGEEVQTRTEAKTEELTDTKTDAKADVGVENDVESSLSGNENSEDDSLWNQDTGSNQVLFAGQSSQNVGQVSEIPQTQFTSYFSADTVQIMEQIAEQIKVVVTPDTTSMEMQLNPENLGKVYLHVSTEEGMVNAQFTATNEVVKEALETQIATLRENLTQAGIKVDAIEVTIASHEFERNLEQNQKNPEEQVEEAAPRRRNITVDSLDELQGIMTEEETLVAQIMKDNGNSVDFTA